MGVQIANPGSAKVHLGSYFEQLNLCCWYVEKPWNFVTSTVLHDMTLSTICNSFSSAGGTAKAIHCYDPVTDDWISVVHTLDRQESCGMTVCGGKLYITGIASSYNLGASIYALGITYCIFVDRWERRRRTGRFRFRYMLWSKSWKYEDCDEHATTRMLSWLCDNS